MSNISFSRRDVFNPSSFSDFHLFVEKWQFDDTSRGEQTRLLKIVCSFGSGRLRPHTHNVSSCYYDVKTSLIRMKVYVELKRKRRARTTTTVSLASECNSVCPSVFRNNAIGVFYYYFCNATVQVAFETCLKTPRLKTFLFRVELSRVAMTRWNA